MDPNTFPTKGNLILAKNALALSKQGFDLMDKKRNILIRELMELISEASDIQNQIDETFSNAYQALQKANIQMGIHQEEQIAKAVPVENSIRIKRRSVMGTEIPKVEYEKKKQAPAYSFYHTRMSLDEACQQFEKVKRKRQDMGERWRQPEEFGNLVFLTSMGSPIGRYNIESDMRYVTRQINDMFRTEALYSGGIPKKFERVHPHALRHTFATRCFEKGMTPRTVQEIMGHANYNTTVSYTHVLDDIKSKEAEKVGEFLQNKNNDAKIEYSGLLGIM